MTFHRVRQIRSASGLHNHGIGLGRPLSRRIRAALRPTPSGILGSPDRDHAVAVRRKLAHVIGGKSSF